MKATSNGLFGKNCTSIKGNIDSLTADETAFIKYVIDSFDDVIEIQAVNELGFTDIWIVLPECDTETTLKRINTCQEYIQQYRLSEIHYLILTPENFTDRVSRPLLCIIFERK